MNVKAAHKLLFLYNNPIGVQYKVGHFPSIFITHGMRVYPGT